MTRLSGLHAPIRREREGGFTLVEMLVTVSLLAVVGVIVLSSTTAALRASRRQADRTAQTNEVRTAFERMTQDLRGANPVLAAQPRRLVVEVTVDQERRTVTYDTVTSGGTTSVRQTEVTENLGTGTSATTTRTVLGEVVLPVGTSLFTYTAADGTAVPAEATPTPRCVAGQTCYDAGVVDVIELRVSVPLAESSQTVDFAEAVAVRNKEKLV